MFKRVEWLSGYFVRLFRNQPAILFFFFFLFLITITNQVHFFYPDEFENILGGRFILRGLLPYRDFFTHHNPLAYFLSVPLIALGGISFVKFRILLGVVYVAFWLGLFLFVKKRYEKQEVIIFAAYLLFIVFGATYFWGHMLLADSFSGYLLIPPYVLVLFNILSGKATSMKDIWIISIFLSFSLLTTSTVLFAVGLFYLFATALFLKDNKLRDVWKPVLILLFPYIVFLLYLVITGSLDDFYFQAIRYNTDIYVKFEGGVPVRNPLRVAIVILYEFLQNFKIILNQIKDLSFERPLPHALALSNLAVWVYLLLNKKYSLAFFSFFFIVFLTARANPMSTGETDYHAFQYQHISIFNGLVALFYMWKGINLERLANRKVVYSFFAVFLGLYLGFLLFHLIERWYDKTYQKYMGNLPLIYDRPSVARELNDLLGSSEFYFVGPFDFENQIYLDPKPASKYIVVLPGFDSSPKIQNELLDDLKKNRPKLIVYDTEKTIFLKGVGEFLRGYLSDNYVNLEELRIKDKGYGFKQKWYGEYDFERHFFLDRNRQDELLALLESKGYLRIAHDDQK